MHKVPLSVPICPAAAEHLQQWAELRIALWPWDTTEDHAEEAAELYLAGDPHRAAFVAHDRTGVMTGFAEASLRFDYVEGCETSPVAYLEGVYVRPEMRRGGIARALVAAVADWGRERGCTEFGSDALIDNVESHGFHTALGFAEAERIVHFRKLL